MKAKLLMLVVAAMLLVGSALPALASHRGPSEPDCDWYRMSNRAVDSDVWGYWCYWEDDGWYLYYIWTADWGYSSVY